MATTINTCGGRKKAESQFIHPFIHSYSRIFDEICKVPGCALQVTIIYSVLILAIVVGVHE